MRSLYILVLTLLFSSCTPTVYYLGDSFQRTDSVEIFYDEDDVKKDYRTIGQLTHDKVMQYSVEKLKTAFISKAKAVGANGIIFIDTVVKRENPNTGDRLEIKAKLIKYLD